MDLKDWKTKSDIITQFRRLKELFETNYIQSFPNTQHIFYQSVFLEIIIRTDDLLQKIKKVNRISFTDDIPHNVELFGEKKNDITDLIRYFRNALCHIDNNKRSIETITIHFMVLEGLSKAHVSGIDIEGKYRDDFFIVFGGRQLYIRRHLVRVFVELKAAYSAIPELDLSKNL